MSMRQRSKWWTLVCCCCCCRFCCFQTWHERDDLRDASTRFCQSKLIDTWCLSRSIVAFVRWAKQEVQKMCERVLLKLSSFMQNNNYFFKRFAVVWMKRSVVCKLDPVLEFSFFCFLFFFPSSLLSGGGAWVELVSFVRGAEERHQTGCLYFFSPSSPHTRPKTSCPVTTHR